MKKILTICIIVSISFLLYSAEREVTDNLNTNPIEVVQRDVPNYEFAVNPTNLVTTYYDYQPGSYNGLPMHVQPEISQPNGYNAGGLYITFHAQETVSSNRRAYFAYVDAAGEIQTIATISSDNLFEGYVGLDIDPVTADPFASWHVDVDDDEPQEIMFSFDFFHAAGGAGLWNDPVIAIDNGNVTSPYNDDKFIWSFVNIGQSPQGPEYRRIYITATNSTDHGNGSAHNPMLVYADYTTDDLDNLTPFDWTYRTIPQMDVWDSDDPEIHTQSKIAFVTSENDGKVAFIGWNVGHGFIAVTNDNYGEGDFTLHTDEFRKYVENPMNEDGTYRFTDVEGNPYEDLNFFFRYNGYFNADYIENESKISFTGNLGLQATDPLDPTLTDWWGYGIYPKQFYFDLNTQQFGFRDIYPRGANPNDENPMLPWDLDEDGTPDNYNEEGIVQFAEGWPFFYHLSAASNNVYKFAKNEENGWLAMVWHDGTKAKHANNETPGYETWLEFPEIAVAVSADNGVTWSDPIFLNANPEDDNYTQQLDGMIHSYINPGNLIEDLGVDEFGIPHGKLHLFFLDDNSYGSFVLGHGLENGGMLKYAALDIEFPANSSAGNEDVTSLNSIGLHNYPNPFNPETRISFEINNELNEQMQIEIYNIKGQIVKTYPIVLNGAEGSIVWNGKDEAENSVSSGLYFYKLNVGDRSVTKKMLLLK